MSSPSSRAVHCEDRQAVPDGAGTPEVSVLIVAYNSADLIGACIGSVATAAPSRSYEILLVDNGDGSTEALVAREFPEVRIIPSRGNIGFAAGNNLLASYARADMFLLLNPDMVALPGSIDALLEASQRYPRSAAWGGVTVDPDGKPDVGNAIAMPSLAEFLSVALGRSRIGSAPVAGLEQDACVDVLIGGFVMFSRSAWEDVGGLDERYFLYCEEVDLFYRLQQRGYEAWRISGAKGAHTAAHGNSLSPMRLLYRAAGTMEFVRAHWPLPARVLAGFLVWIAAVERLVAGRLFGARAPHLRKLGNGYRLVALRPAFWIFGYHKRRGLMAKLARSPISA
jgi:GT2 family glycosyltransferase